MQETMGPLAINAHRFTLGSVFAVAYFSGSIGAGPTKKCLPVQRCLISNVKAGDINCGTCNRQAV